MPEMSVTRRWRIGLAGLLATAVSLTYAQAPASAAPLTAVPAVEPSAALAADAPITSTALLASYDISEYDDDADVSNRVEGAASATLRNGPTFVSGGPFQATNTNSGIALDGTDDYVDTSIALATTQSFTVSAWVRLDRVDRAQAVIAQNGSRVSNFRIGLDAAGKWQLTMPRTDADAPTSDTVTGPAATAAKWTHLTGVYDSTTAKMTLYVNGTGVAPVTHSAPWAAANGGVQWGRALSAGAATGYADGTISQLRVFQAALDARQASELTTDPAQARAARCDAAQYLHAGGPAVKALAGRVLAGTDYDRRAATFAADYDPSDLYEASGADDATYLNAYSAQGARYTAWQSVLGPYTIFGSDSTGFKTAPKYGEASLRFLMQRSDTTWHNYFIRPPAPKPAQAELDKALAIAAQMRAEDSWNGPADWQVKTWSASRVARLLRYGGFVKVAPTPGTLEYRNEVESVKLLWAACETDDPDGTLGSQLFYLSDGPLAGVVDTARQEWAAELAAVAGQRNSIVAAETQAQANVRSASAALVEAQGQAWIVGQLLKWKKYWLAQPKTASGYPTTAQWTKAQTDITTATNAINGQLTLATTATTAAQAQATTAATALTAAAAIAKANGTPMYRGLAYAQQSSQVVKASAAAALSAQKAIETTLNAAKATNADGAALQSLALVQQSALQAEFRRVAAQEAAAQAHAAALAAADQATQAAAAAARAKADRATAEKAEAAAKAGAADAHAKRLTAEKERDNATAHRQQASAERAKASAARTRAEEQQRAAASAKASSASQEETAYLKMQDAEDAEIRAEEARDNAVAAENRRDAAASRASALEALAAKAAAGSDAAEARAAADQARSDANAASSAAVSARAAANDATTAAKAARAAATKAQAAADRSTAAWQGAESAAAGTRSAWLTAQAAAADALKAAEQASWNAKEAEAQAVIAADKAVTARNEADAAQKLADEATAESARTAGAAYAASEAAFAARDSAAQAVTAANDAISMGTPFEQTDASAGFAVLVGQSAKSIAEQQAATAELRAAEAARAAAAAATAAANAQADAKLAAQAAAAAAADAAAAAQSMLAARASAAAAAADAKAAQEAEKRAGEYDAQAQLDAFYAEVASNNAQAQASLADSEASDAERDAAGARAAATEAESDAAAAQSSADRADGYATEAEASAAHADELAGEAEAAADRAEAEERAEEKARRDALLAEGANPEGWGVEGGAGAAFGADDEAILLAQCGQACVDEYRQAMANANLTLLDWLKANGGQILLDVIGYTDAKECFTKGDIEGCIWTAVNAVSIVLLVGKIPAVSAAIVRISGGVTRFFEAAAAGKRSIDRLRNIIARAKKLPDPKVPFCSVKKGAAAKAAASTAADPTPPCFAVITRDKDIKRFKNHWKDHKALLEKLLNKHYPKWRVDEGQSFLDDIHEVIKSGRVKYIGPHQLNSTSDVGHLYRGEGITIAIHQDGTFWTLLKSGVGMDNHVIPASLP
ncbi:LamG domain-containing protein [Actinoplanes sp. CA-054009]